MQSIFEKLLDNLVVAALVPSLVFFTVLTFLFGDLVPPDVAEKLRLIFGTRAILIITMASCTSFVLSYLSETIYWLYRGEFLPKWMNALEKNRAKKLRGEIDTLTSQINQLIQINVSDPTLLKAIEKRKNLVEHYQYTFPPLEAVLPTHFGNILSAAEGYPALHYGIKSRQMWVRLKQVIPAENMGKIDQVNHELAFLVNSSLFSILLSGFAFCGMLYQLFLFLIALVQTILSLFTISTGAWGLLFSGLLYGGLSLIFLGVAWLFYRLSLPIAQRYAEIYRCAFDLFRFQLVEQLRFDCPASTLAERTLWKVFDDFINSDADANIHFTYTHPGHAESEREQGALVEEFVSADEFLNTEQ